MKNNKHFFPGESSENKVFNKHILESDTGNELWGRPTLTTEHVIWGRDLPISITWHRTTAIEISLLFTSFHNRYNGTKSNIQQRKDHGKGCLYTFLI